MPLPAPAPELRFGRTIQLRAIGLRNFSHRRETPPARELNAALAAHFFPPTKHQRHIAMSAIDNAAVRAGDAAYAAQMLADRLQLKLARRTITLADRDKPTTGSGDFRLFSVRRVLQIAIAERLGRLGIRPRVAGVLAATAVGLPGTAEPTGFLLKQPDQPARIVANPPSGGVDAVVVDVGAQLALVRDRLASRVPELRAAGIV